MMYVGIWNTKAQGGAKNRVPAAKGAAKSWRNK